MKNLMIMCLALVASLAIAEPQMNKQLEETYEKLEVYDADGASFAVEVDYTAHHSCGRSYHYLLTEIDDSNLIVTKRVLPRRAYCPSPDRWPLIVQGLRFMVEADSGSRINAKYLWVPKGSQVVLRGADELAGLPAGLSALSLTVELKYVASPSLSANVFGVLNNANSAVVLSEPKVDAKKKLAVIELKVKTQITDLPTPEGGLGFAEAVTIPTPAKGLWTVVLVDSKGNSLSKAQLKLK